VARETVLVLLLLLLAAPCAVLFDVKFKNSGVIKILLLETGNNVLKIYSLREPAVNCYDIYDVSTSSVMRIYNQRAAAAAAADFDQES
jgi:hypothetical protein